MVKSLRVKIFGSEYPLRGEDEEFTKRVATYVDEMIERIHTKIPDQPPLTIAVLTALNVTEDMMKDREKNHIVLQNLNGELQKISQHLSDVLSESGN
jgi:cell division protein ZapA (FtsZ GTPase activity inhibitor)